MAMFDEKLTEMLTKALADLRNPVRLLVFTREHECQFCTATRDLLTELAALSDLLTTEAHNMDTDTELVEQYGIERTPAIVIQGAEDVGLRYYGVPAQHEFATLIEAILDIGTGRPSPLAAETITALQDLDQPVTLKVFVTPTCPHCPSAVRVAHLFAQASPQVRGEAIEASEFPELIQKYSIQGVPKTVINEDADFVGAQPEQAVLQHILAALGKA